MNIYLVSYFLFSLLIIVADNYNWINILSGYTCKSESILNEYEKTNMDIDK